MSKNIWYDELREIIKMHFDNNKNPFELDKEFILRYPNNYKYIETYPEKIIKSYLHPLISHEIIDRDTVYAIINTNIPISTVFSYNSVSNVDDIMRRYRLLLTLFDYVNLSVNLRNTKNSSIKKSVFSLLESINKWFINENHVYLRSSTENENRNIEFRSLNIHNQFMCNRIRLMMNKNINNINVISDKLNFVLKTIWKYYISVNTISFDDMSENDKIDIIATVIYLCTDNLEFYDESSMLLKNITTIDKIIYDTNSEMLFSTWNILSDYIHYHISPAFKIWLDCNPYTHPCANYKNYFFVQGMEFLYVMSIARSPHSNRFRLEKFMETKGK